jgi:hypothetical protein
MRRNTRSVLCAAFSPSLDRAQDAMTVLYATQSGAIVDVLDSYRFSMCCNISSALCAASGRGDRAHAFMTELNDTRSGEHDAIGLMWWPLFSVAVLLVLLI